VFGRMANAADIRCRLCLVTPPDYAADAFASDLAAALSGGDVASLIVTAPRGGESEFQKAAEALVPIAQARGVAALIHNETRIAARSRADGIHIDTGTTDLSATRQSLRGGIVGAGGVESRHDALECGEADPDYVFFGRLHGDDGAGIFPKALALAAWWSSVTVIPAIVSGGRDIASIDEAAQNGIAFVALSAAVWTHPEGPRRAVAKATDRLATVAEPVS
jgi:thiamine-phosphate pyrophosphorylase